jgi:general secretion pathway protein A
VYLEHFGLTMFPFSTTPDPRFYYPSAKHREALACLIYAVEQHKGFALITGEVGAGKSMVCRAALQKLGDRVDTAMIVHSSLSPKQFFQATCEEFNIQGAKRSKIELIQAIKGFLLQRQEEGRTTVLIVDEAQNLSRNVLEEVRLLGNLESSTAKLLQIILVGQPELRRLIATPELRQLNQRITVKFHLGALTAADVGAYIIHRLAVAGLSNGALFEPDAQEEIFKAAGGIPRMVNVICDQALLQAYISDEKAVRLDTVKRVLSEMEGYYMDAPAPMRNAGERVH